MNKDYKPLGVAVFLAVAGLLSSFLFLPKAALTEVRNASGGSVLIPQAQGAEVDSAALTVQHAPFLASANGGEDISSTQNAEFFYNEGAVRDPIQAIESPKIKPANTVKKTLLYGLVYTVNNGDTLESIAATFNVSTDKIVQFNPSVNFSSLDPGISIIVPGKNDVNVLAPQD